MRWFPFKEGYQKKPLWLNIDLIICIRFTTGADGQPMAYLVGSNGAELTTHDAEDLEKLQQIIQRNAC